MPCPTRKPWREQRYPARAIAAVVACLTSLPAAAQTNVTWNNAGSDWTVGANWNPSGPPGTADTAQFDPAFTFGTTAVQPTLNSASTISQLIFANNASGNGWLLSGSGSLTSG